MVRKMIGAKETWEAVLDRLKLQVNKTNYDTWLRGTVGLNCERNQFVVGVPSPFALEWLDTRLRSLIKKTIIDIGGRELDISFQVHQGDGGKPAPGEVKRRPSGFNPRYTFDSFITGECNRMAHAAAMGVAEKPGVLYNPLFIYSGPGLGKTHLLHAIGNMLSQTSLSVLYVSTEQFTNDFIRAIRERKTEEFRQKYRGVDVLLIDDVQFIIGKEQTQEGFFHTFNDLHNGNCQIVLTSDRSPKDMSLVEDRLRSRFEWGLIADIQLPDFQTRLAILETKAQQLRAKVPTQVLDMVAHRANSNVRDLEGSLNCILALAKLSKAQVTSELAEAALSRHSRSAAAPRGANPCLIVEAVSAYFDISSEALKGRARDRQTALARHIAVYLIKEETGRSFAEIGREFGGRDHSVILRSYQKVAAEVETDSQLRTDVLEIRNRLHIKAANGVRTPVKAAY